MVGLSEMSSPWTALTVCASSRGVPAGVPLLVCRMQRLLSEGPASSRMCCSVPPSRRQVFLLTPPAPTAVLSPLQRRPGSPLLCPAPPRPQQLSCPGFFLLPLSYRANRRRASSLSALYIVRGSRFDTLKPGYPPTPSCSLKLSAQ